MSTSGVSWTTTGHTGNAMLFDGASGFVTASNTPSLNPVEELSVQAWIYQIGNSATNNAVVAKEGSYVLAVNNGQVQLGLSTIGAPTFAYVGSGAVPLNTWTHIMATYDGLAVRTFVNGVPTSWTSAPNGRINTTNNNLRLGLRQGNIEGFAGRIDEVRILGIARFQETRVVRRYQAVGLGDDSNDAVLSGRTVTYPKRAGGTGLHVVWTDNFRVYNNNTACSWEVMFNGSPCNNPGPLRYDKYEGNTFSNRFDPTTVTGTCFGLPAGNVVVNTRVRPQPGYRGTPDCYTGWYTQLVSLEVEEVQ